MQLDIMFEYAFWGYFIPSKGSFLIFSGVNLLFFIVSYRSDPKVTEADIDAKSWQGNAGGFAGPGSTRELAKTAVAFFKSHPNWGQNPDTDNLKILNACVTGNWDVAETNIFGQVIQWRLHIHLAITNGKLEPKGIARVYELSVLTQKGNPGQVKKAPPFDGYWVGNNWMMRLEKLP
jgi:hypothetical protein